MVTPRVMAVASLNFWAAACVAAARGTAEPDTTARMARSLSDRIKLAEIIRIEPMKLSARNMLPGKVVAVTQGASTAHEKVELASGLTVMSAITNDSVAWLALKIGDSVSSVSNASEPVT